MTSYTGPVLFFDGVCNLCNGAVQFIIKHDKTGRIKFASLQSAAGLQAQEAVSRLKGYVPDSLIFFTEGNYYTESDAALEVTRFLDGFWKGIGNLRIFPRGLRNGVYRGIAKQRYSWFGRRDSCMLPTPELKDRFIS